MKETSTVEHIRTYLAFERARGSRVAFVPTMGYLHEGHLSLVRLASARADVVVVSLFVNPLQFNDRSDFERYPVHYERDRSLLQSCGVHVLFAPTVQEIYPSGYLAASQAGTAPRLTTTVAVENLSAKHEGEFRPGHFSGVTTVVTILFNIVRPDIAVFGEKDFQQLRIIEQMAADLQMGIQIVRGPVVREPDGLAMSSRNVRLSPEGRSQAVLLSRGLRRAKEAVDRGEKSSARIVSIAMEELHKGKLVRPEYVRVVREDTLDEIETVSDNARVLVAAFVENVRLIDTVGL